ncbi:hypothetical protein V6N13_138891 [Hibiscus sabdariffa]|uniref:Uncharacterized protein n=1 Tax=Hibiscus sabdariffa TaxID=183260 RepID=A0ABR2PKA8_9ROSI
MKISEGIDLESSIPAPPLFIGYLSILGIVYLSADIEAIILLVVLPVILPCHFQLGEEDIIVPSGFAFTFENTFGKIFFPLWPLDIEYNDVLV